MYRTVLVALDGSPDSRAGGCIALALARHLGCRVQCVHVYDERIHDTRFREMEPGLPERYQQPEYLAQLRASHGDLMSDGFAALSRGYLEEFLARGREAGVPVEEVVEQGRNYVALIRRLRSGAVDLVVLGATGLGAQGDGLLGSTAARVLRAATCDVVVARDGGADGNGGGPILVGVDGSPEALEALQKARVWARAGDRPLHLAAAYDPGLHRHVFETMGRSLSPQRQEEVGLDRQQQLHEDLIDDGLGRLYQVFLDQALSTAGSERPPPAHLLQGKAYRALVDWSRERGADLIAVGRYGHHRKEEADLGSTAEAVVRTAPCSVLVAGGSQGGVLSKAVEEKELAWDADALARLERIPSFARVMARRAVEERVRAVGGERVTAADFARAAQAFGMGPPPGPMPPEGEEG